MNLKSYLRGIGAGLIVAALVLGTSTQKEKLTDAEIIERAKTLGMIQSQKLSEINTSSSDTIKEDEPLKEDEVLKEDTNSEISSSENETLKTDTSTDEISKKDEGNEENSKDSDLGKEASDDEKSEDSNLDKEASDSENFRDSDLEKEDFDSEASDGEISEDKTLEPINPLPEGESGFLDKDGYVSIQIIKGDSSVSVSRRMYEAGLVESAVEFDDYLCQNGYDKVISVGNYNIAYGMSFEEMAKIITRRQ